MSSSTSFSMCLIPASSLPTGLMFSSSAVASMPTFLKFYSEEREKGKMRVQGDPGLEGDERSEGTRPCRCGIVN